MRATLPARTIAAALAWLAVGPLCAQPAPTVSSPADLGALAWLRGQWTATDGDASLTQYYSPALGGVVVGMLQRTAPNEEPRFEMTVVQATPAGVELRQRRFGRRLEPQDGGEPRVLALAEATPDRVVFRAESGSAADIVLERRGDGRFVAHSAGGPIEWRRIAVDLPGAETGSGALGAFAFLAGHWVSPFGPSGEVHELRLAPDGDVLLMALCRLQNGAAASLELSTLEPDRGRLRAYTWQFGLELRAAASGPPIQA